MGLYFSNKVDTDKPYYKVTVKSESGFLAFGKPWPRGAQILVQADSESYQRTKNISGESWLDSPSTNYTVAYLDSEKDEKPKETLVLEVDEEVEEAADTPAVPKAPTRRGKPKTSSKE